MAMTEAAKLRETTCTDESHEYYPFYGLAPHVHAGGRIIGSTRTLDKSEWPDNFTEDPDSPGCGVYKCPGCMKLLVSETISKVCGRFAEGT